MENVYKAIDEVILCIKESDDYKKCLDLKEKINSNQDVKDLIERLKSLQKKYIKSNYDSTVKEELDKCREELFNIPIYNIYIDSLEKVNQKIDYVRDTLNSYFEKLLNP